MYTLHIANKNYSSWSLRPWVLMRALSIPFEEQLSPFKAASNWAEFRAFSPGGTVPCLQDGNTSVWDSLAITEYLAERHVGVWPRDSNARAWARCAAAEMHAGFSTLRNLCPMNCGLRVEMAAVSPALQKNIERLDELWSEGLTRFGGTYLAGAEFSAVDAFYAPVAFRVQTFGLKIGAIASEYGQRLLAHPAMQDWYQAALTEPWREPAHEEECRSIGTVLADHRAAQPE